VFANFGPKKSLVLRVKSKQPILCVLKKAQKQNWQRASREWGDEHLQRKRSWHGVTITDLAEINT
jgi:hypothetical protein